MSFEPETPTAERRREFAAWFRANNPGLFPGKPPAEVVEVESAMAKVEALAARFREEPCPPLSYLAKPGATSDAGAPLPEASP